MSKKDGAQWFRKEAKRLYKKALQSPELFGSPQLMRVQHHLAQTCGFNSWGDLLRATEEQKKTAILAYQNAAKN